MAETPSPGGLCNPSWQPSGCAGICPWVCALLFVFHSELGPHFALITHVYFPSFWFILNPGAGFLCSLRSLEWCMQGEQPSCRSGKGTCASSVCEQKCRRCNCDAPVNLCLSCNSSSHRLLAGGSHMGLACAYKQLCAHLPSHLQRPRHVEHTPASLQPYLLSGFLCSGGLVCQTASLKETSIPFHLSDQIYLPKLSFYPGIYAG